MTIERKDSNMPPRAHNIESVMPHEPRSTDGRNPIGGENDSGTPPTPKPTEPRATACLECLTKTTERSFMRARFQ